MAPHDLYADPDDRDALVASAHARAAALAGGATLDLVYHGTDLDAARFTASLFGATVDVVDAGATLRFTGTPDAVANVAAALPRCDSGWTGDRCSFPLFHRGPHSNDGDGFADGWDRRLGDWSASS